MSDDIQDPDETQSTEESTENAQGKIFKKARQAKGLSLEAVHEVTKIPLDSLRAIEEGYTVGTLSPFYRKGFVKIYAQYLDIDLSDVIDDYKKEQLPKHIEKPAEGINLEKWVEQNLTRERKQQLVVIAGIILAIFVLFKFAFFLAQREQRRPNPPTVKFEPQQPMRYNQGTSETPQQPREQVRTGTPVRVRDDSFGVAQKNVTLVVHAKRSSWLRVKVDGKIVFQATLRAGAVETWKADDSIELSGRYLNQLEYELNGKLIGTLGRKDRKAKRLIVTKDGLTVTQ